MNLLKTDEATRRITLVWVLIILILLSLLAWHAMPIYPDEIAFRIQAGRYIQDKGVIYGLYALCSSNFKETPFLLMAPAWVFSWLDLNLTPTETRVLPGLTVLCVIVMAIWQSAKNVSPLAAIVSTTALIGVSGSGLILARAEYVQLLNIACCLGAYIYLCSELNRRIYLSSILIFLVTFSGLLSVYAHPQGLLFLPLSVYLIYRMLLEHFRNSRLTVAVLLAVSFLFTTLTCLEFYNQSCAGYPKIEQFWQRMTFSSAQLNPLDLPDWFQIKIDKYYDSFLYREHYAVNYLPGLISDGVLAIYILIINCCVAGIIVFNIVSSMIIVVVEFFAAILRVRGEGAQQLLFGIERIFSKLLIPALFILPVFVLFGYDSAQNFYRSFFINLLFSIFISLYLSSKNVYRARFIYKACFWGYLLTMIASLFINIFWFSEQLNAGYEGPSISTKRSAAGFESDIKDLEADCKIDLNKGRIVVDDLTYESVKKYPAVFPATYLGLMAGLTGTQMDQVINIVGPNFAIAQCDTLLRTKIGYDHQKNKLCCKNFLSAGESE